MSAARPFVSIAVVRGLLAVTVALTLTAPGAPRAASPAAGKAGSKAGAKPGSKSGADEEELERIRALPYVDFVEGDTGEVATGITIADEGRFQEGYTLYTNRGICRVDLLDQAGEVANTWLRTPCHNWAHSDLRPNGDLLVISMGPVEGIDAKSFPDQRSLLRFSWDGRLLAETGGAPHHSFDVLPDGRILLLTVRPRRIPAVDPDVDVRDENLTLMSPEGEILEEHSLYDIISEETSGFRLRRAGQSLVKRLGSIDLIHSNALQRLPWDGLAGSSPAHAPGAVLVTLRHQNAVIAVDVRSWKMIWAWGQEELAGPHDGTWLENGNVLIFDNGIGRRWSRVVEMSPATGEIAWEYKAPEPRELFSRTNGAAQRLRNGNTLITDSNKGRAFEVTPDGEVVWKLVNPRVGDVRGRSTIVKAFRLPPGYVERARAAGEAAAGRSPAGR